MNNATMNAITAKWLTILLEYEKIKAGNSTVFKTVDQLCQAHHVHRKDIRKYYERWIKSGKDRSSLLPRKRGPKPGKYRLLSKQEERIIINIHRLLGANEFEIFHLLKNNPTTRLTGSKYIHRYQQSIELLRDILLTKFVKLRSNGTLNVIPVNYFTLTLTIWLKL